MSSDSSFNHSSDSHLNESDLSVLRAIIGFWFPNKSFQDFWFSSEYDSHIKVRYTAIWKKVCILSVDSMIGIVGDIKASTDAKDIYLAIIICLDQFTRNLIRTEDRSLYAETDTKCIEFVKRMSVRYPLDSFGINQRIFVLLPYRHQRKTSLLDFVMMEIRKMENEIASIASDAKDGHITTNIVNRFKLATIKDYSKVTDTIVHYKNDVGDTKDSRGFCSTHLMKNDDIYTICSGIKMIDDSDDMKSAVFAEVRKALDHVLDDKCLKDYSFNPVDLNSDIVRKTPVYIATRDFLTKNSIVNVCVSLSGGVDSMVISYILHHLKLDGFVKNFCAVHVDYGNRNVSRDEAYSVEAWCEYIGIPLITRRIEHIKRHDATILTTDAIDRSVYEAETKNIRFNLYREAMKLYGVTSVILGHHRDDLTENVLMNVLRGGDIHNLFTMKEHQILDGVPISRPLLVLPKSDIYKVAHKFEVPYLKDTTSEECFRGIVRKTILPALESIDPSVRIKINSIGESSDQWNGVINSQIIAPVIESVTDFKYGFSFPYNDSYSKMNFVAWQKLLTEIFHRRGYHMISNKNLHIFMSWTVARCSGFSRLSNDLMVFLHENTHNGANMRELVFVKAGVSSRHQSLMKTPSGADIPLEIKTELPTSPATIQFNGWSINIEPIDEAEIKRCDNIGKGHLDLKSAMNGEFHFFYRTCKHPNSHSVGTDTCSIANINYCIGHKSSDNKSFFKNFMMARYIPNVHLGIPCASCKKAKDVITYKITYRYV
jgi:tRNA(Ile)-lysidine synthetase-like protein